MSSSDVKKCDNCGSICDVNDSFCGTCGKTLSVLGSGEKDPKTLLTVHPERRRQGPTTPRLDDTVLSGNISQLSPRTHSNKIYLIVIAVLVLMLIGSGVLVGILLGRENTQGTISKTLSNSNQSRILPTNATTTVMTSTPSPTPKPATVLYQADWSKGLNGWNGTDEWYVASGILRSRGIDYDLSVEPTLVAPYYVEGTHDYAVEARIKIDGVGNERCFFISLRGTTSKSGWNGYKGAVCQNYARIQLNSDVIAETPFDAGPNWHLYRIEVQGSTLHFFIDGGQVLQAKDGQFPTGGQVGLKTWGGQIEVDELKILVL